MAATGRYCCALGRASPALPAAAAAARRRTGRGLTTSWSGWWSQPPSGAAGAGEGLRGYHGTSTGGPRLRSAGVLTATEWRSRWHQHQHQQPARLHTFSRSSARHDDVAGWAATAATDWQHNLSGSDDGAEVQHQHQQDSPVWGDYDGPLTAADLDEALHSSQGLRPLGVATAGAGGQIREEWQSDPAVQVRICVCECVLRPPSCPSPLPVSHLLCPWAGIHTRVAAPPCHDTPPSHNPFS